MKAIVEEYGDCTLRELVLKYVDHMRSALCDRCGIFRRTKNRIKALGNLQHQNSTFGERKEPSLKMPHLSRKALLRSEFATQRSAAGPAVAATKATTAR